MTIEYIPINNDRLPDMSKITPKEMFALEKKVCYDPKNLKEAWGIGFTYAIQSNILSDLSYKNYGAGYIATDMRLIDLSIDTPFDHVGRLWYNRNHKFYVEKIIEAYTNISTLIASPFLFSPDLYGPKIKQGIKKQEDVERFFHKAIADWRVNNYRGYIHHIIENLLDYKEAIISFYCSVNFKKPPKENDLYFDTLIKFLNNIIEADYNTRKKLYKEVDKLDLFTQEEDFVGLHEDNLLFALACTAYNNSFKYYRDRNNITRPTNLEMWRNYNVTFNYNLKIFPVMIYVYRDLNFTPK